MNEEKTIKEILKRILSWLKKVFSKENFFTIVLEGEGIETTVIKKQLFQNMLYNLVAFTVIFTIFGTVIYSQVKLYIFYNVENELSGYGDTTINIRKTNIIDASQGRIITSHMIPEGSLTIQNPDTFFTAQIGQLINNPKIIYLLRDKDGNVINRSKYGKDL